MLFLRTPTLISRAHVRGYRGGSSRGRRVSWGLLGAEEQRPQGNCEAYIWRGQALQGVW